MSERALGRAHQSLCGRTRTVRGVSLPMEQGTKPRQGLSVPPEQPLRGRCGVVAVPEPAPELAELLARQVAVAVEIELREDLLEAGVRSLPRAHDVPVLVEHDPA